MAEPTCQYGLFAELSQQQDIESLNESLLQLLNKNFETDTFRLYLRSDSSTNRQYILQQGISFSGDQHWLDNIQASGMQTVTHTEHNGTHCWYIRLEHIPVGVLLYDSDRLGEQGMAFIHNTLTIYTNLYNLLNNATLDSLTGLYNRQAFEQMMNKLLMTCSSAKRRSVDQDKYCYFSLLDIDHFKAINDRHGHLFGDEVLLHFAQLMKNSFRDEDLLFRYGGEEFAVALLVEDTETAHRVLERFREQVANYHFPQVGTVTVSIGYTTIKSNHILTTLTDEADKALYYAKDQGRNQTQNYDELIKENKLVAPDSSGDVELF